MSWSSRSLRENVLATEVGPESLGHRSLFVLQAPNQMLAFALHTTWGLASTDHDLTFHLLQGGARPICWTRTGESSFELESLGVPFLALPFERVYLSDSKPFEVGERRQSSGLEVEVLGVEAGLPTRLGFTLAVPPDDPRVGFLVAEGAGLVRTPTLRVGESRSFAAPTHEGPWVP